MATTAPRSNTSTAAGEPEYLKPAEIATRLRLAKMTVYRLIDSGQLPGTIRVGRSFRVPYSAFQAYVRACEVGE